MDKVREISLKRYPIRDFGIEVGDTVKVALKIKEGSKERVQIFEGVIIKIQGKDFDRSFTVRKISSGIGVEKTMPLNSPNVTNIEIISRAKVRRARLFYLRKLQGRAARLNSKRFQGSKAATKVVKVATKVVKEVSDQKQS